MPAASADLDTDGNRELYTQGQEIYARMCAVCHGADLHSAANQLLDLSNFPAGDQQRFFSALINGKGVMPAYSGILTQEEILQLWIYVSYHPKPLSPTP